MDNQRTSLLQKYISNRFSLTPIEIIHLQYLSEKGTLEKWINNELILNPYLGIKNYEGNIPNFYLEVLENRARSEFPKLYRSSNYAYKNFWYINTTLIGECYKGLALLTQLQYMRSEYIEKLTLDKNFNSEEIEKDILFSINRFTLYSFVHEKEVTFLQVVESLLLIFEKLVIGITNVLILNYYLTEIIDADEIVLFNFLKTLYTKENGLQPYFDKQTIDSIIESNHRNYLENISFNLVNIPYGFSEHSLNYVKQTIYNRINLDS